MTAKTTTKKPKKSEPWGGALNAFGKAFDQIKVNPKPAVIFGAVYVFVTAIQISTLDPNAPLNSRHTVLLFGYEMLVYLAFLLALPTYALAIADRRRISLNDFLNFHAKKYLSVLIVSVLYGMIVILSLLTFIIPAIWTIAWFALCVVLVVDKGLGPVEALKESKRLVQNHKGKVWGIIGITIAFSLAASIMAVFPIVGPLFGSLVSSLITILSTSSVALLTRWAQSLPESKLAPAAAAPKSTGI